MINMKNKIIKLLILLSYLSMITFNFLANALPINNISTGEISEMYPNLFAPAGFTFSIWGLIYIFLGAYVLYQLGFFKYNKNLKRSKKDGNNKKKNQTKKENLKNKDRIYERVGIYFIITSLANVFWIFSWHYDFITLSLLFMGFILYFLIKIVTVLDKENVSLKDYFFISLPFSIYLGWISIATIANIAVFLVSINWGGFGISNQIWTIILLFIGASLGILRVIKNKDVAYGFVFIWAYIGILIKHISFSGFEGQYLGIIIVTSLNIFLIFISIVSIKKATKSLDKIKKLVKNIK